MAAPSPCSRCVELGHAKAQAKQCPQGFEQHAWRTGVCRNCNHSKNCSIHTQASESDPSIGGASAASASASSSAPLQTTPRGRASAKPALSSSMSSPPPSSSTATTITRTGSYGSGLASPRAQPVSTSQRAQGRGDKQAKHDTTEAKEQEKDKSNGTTTAAAKAAVEDASKTTTTPKAKKNKEEKKEEKKKEESKTDSPRKATKKEESRTDSPRKATKEAKRGADTTLNLKNVVTSFQAGEEGDEDDAPKTIVPTGTVAGLLCSPQHSRWLTL